MDLSQDIVLEIQCILDRGNDCEIQQRRDGIVVIECSKHIKKKYNQTEIIRKD